MSIPFSYYLYHIPTKKHYYGIRHGKKSDPKKLWVTYFSSSKVVKQMIDEYGVDSFKVEVRKIFSCSEKAVLWEHKVLRRIDAAGRDDWINRHNGGEKFRGPKNHTLKTKQTIKKKITGLKRNHKTIEKHQKNAAIREQRKKDMGWKMSDSGRKNISDGLKNPEVQAKIYTADRNKKMAESKKGTKRHYLPDGSFIMVKLQADQ